MFDITLGGAALAGLISFLSPCILPIVPFYLSYLAGVSAGDLASDQPISPAVRRRAVLAALLFAAGVITVFVALGASASLLGQWMRDWFDVLRWLAAALITAIGLHFLGVIRLPFLYRQFTADAGDVSRFGLAGAYLIGLAFAFGWTPCVGPVLAMILFMAAAQDTAAQGIGLLVAYGVGMTAPFVLAAGFIGAFFRFLGRFRRHLGWVEKAMGAMLVLFGVLIATGTVNVIANWLLATFPIFTRIG